IAAAAGKELRFPYLWARKRVEVGMGGLRRRGRGSGRVRHRQQKRNERTGYCGAAQNQRSSQAIAEPELPAVLERHCIRPRRLEVSPIRPVRTRLTPLPSPGRGDQFGFAHASAWATEPLCPSRASGRTVLKRSRAYLPLAACH